MGYPEQPAQDQTLDLAELNELLSRNLLEVFNWYCLKFLSFRGDFDCLQQNLHYLNMQGFAFFCSEFKVPLDNRSITEAFKKSQRNNLPLVFEQFD